jgi:flavin-dependent dehydrogenase
LQQDKTTMEKTRMLVGADGASSKVRLLTPSQNPSPKRYLAIQKWVESEDQLPYYSSLFDPEITDYYCWTIPKEDHLIIGAALSPGDKAAEKFKLLKTKPQEYGYRFGKTVWREGAFLLRPMKLYSCPPGLRVSDL